MVKKRLGPGSVDLLPFQFEFRRLQSPYRRERLEYLKQVEPDGTGSSSEVLAWLDLVERTGEQSFAAVIADRLGWTRSSWDDAPDTSRVLRAFGLLGSKCSRSGRRIWRAAVSMETALLLVEGLQVDPVDVGI